MAGEPGTTGERLQLAVAGLDAAREGTAAQARELAQRALADGRLLDDPGPESTGFWIAPARAAVRRRTRGRDRSARM